MNFEILLIWMIKNKENNMHIKILVLSLLLSGSIAHAVDEQSVEQIRFEKDKVKYKSYIPKKYDLFEVITGDLNKDKIQDIVLIVKATDPNAWVDHEYRGKLDRNRRGIVVLFGEKETYKKVMQNLSVFSSENEEGGVYFQPELWIEIKNNLLNIHYAHGRYGYWNYIFRYETHDFRLIGYDSSEHHGPRVESDTSINLMTGKKRYRNNLNQDEEQDSKFKETWTKVNYTPIYLSQIKDMDELYFD